MGSGNSSFPVTAIPVMAAFLLTPGAAQASASYPDLIKQQLGVNCAPACTICHNNPNGGTGSVTTPFGREMMGLHLGPESPASLQTALNEVKDRNLSAIGDGIPDIQALMACMDPNVAPANSDGGGGGVAGSGYSDPTPEYGCAMGLAPDTGSLGLVPLAIGILACRRRRCSAVSAPPEP